MWRNINILGLQPRTAYGQTGANQFLGQIEAGYRVDLGGTASYYVTPFALLQGSTVTQNGFTETGAQSLNLTVAQQTTSWCSDGRGLARQDRRPAPAGPER